MALLIFSYYNFLKWKNAKNSNRSFCETIEAIAESRSAKEIS